MGGKIPRRAQRAPSSGQGERARRGEARRGGGLEEDFRRDGDGHHEPEEVEERPGDGGSGTVFWLVPKTPHPQ